VSQNRSTAVMQRRTEAHDSLDDFPTPPWATRALCEWLKAQGIVLAHQMCREPAANRGFMVRPLLESFGAILASDVHDYGYGYEQRDYLFGPVSHLSLTEWTITNPPVRLAEQFIERALELSEVGVAVILRSAFLESVGRYERLFRHRPPSDVLQFVERVPMVKGRVDEDAASATAYAWLVWRKGKVGTELHWIPPCRKRLERATDYAAPVQEAA
jgi:hypothetical protein